MNTITNEIKPPNRYSLAKTMKLLNVGDSFLVPSSKMSTPYQWAKRNNITVETSKENENEVRVWRTA